MKCAVLPPFIRLTLTFTRCSIPAPSQTLQLCVWEALGKLKCWSWNKTLWHEPFCLSCSPPRGRAARRALLSRSVPRREGENSQKDHTVLCLPVWECERYSAAPLPLDRDEITVFPSNPSKLRPWDQKKSQKEPELGIWLCHVPLGTLFLPLSLVSQAWNRTMCLCPITSCVYQGQGWAGERLQGLD